MQDYGTRHTDLAVKRTEWRLSRVYHQAERDIADKLKGWQEGHEKREARYRQQLAEGKITQADFDAWMRGQVFQEKQWKARQEQIRQTLLNADREAANIVNNGKLGVFAENANYIGYGLEHGANINTGFTLYDEQTVARLIKSDPQILPKAAPGVQKDKAYTYYNKLMNSAITQGIVQGETIPQIARRIARVTGESSYKSAVRNARTAYTGAQNAGRIEGLHQAQELGIKVKKQWMATLDDRTRDSHADLDGQIRDVDEPFDSELGPIDYPGDPTADPGNVYNCRCTLVYIYPDYPSDMQRRDNETGENVGDMTYREWEEMKQSQGMEPIDITEPRREESSKEYIEFDDTEDALDYYIDNGESWVETLTQEEKRAVSDYGYNYLSAESNGYLRGEPDKYSGYQIDAIKEQIRKLDQAIDKGSIPDDMRLYRGVGRDYLGIDFSNPEALIGTTVKEGGFMSVSGESEVAEIYGRGVVLDMSVPKGTHAAYVDLVQSTGSELREYYQEDGDAGNIEYLLERGGSLKFTGYKYEKDENGKEYVRMFCEFVPR